MKSGSSLKWAQDAGPHSDPRRNRSNVAIENDLVGLSSIRQCGKCIGQHQPPFGIKYC